MNERDWLEAVGPEKFAELSAKLARKTAKARELVTGVTLAKDKANVYDKYKYFSEAAYKKLFNEMLMKSGLELTASEISREYYNTNGKNCNGTRVTWGFTLTDTETGFSKTHVVTGDGQDKGDKGIYKADTGAFKYFVANNFLIATGDDPEAESPEGRAGGKDAYTEAILACEQLKQEISEIGINIHEGDAAKYIAEQTGVKGNMPKNIGEAHTYANCLRDILAKKKGRRP